MILDGIGQSVQQLARQLGVDFESLQEQNLSHILVLVYSTAYSLPQATEDVLSEIGHYMPHAYSNFNTLLSSVRKV
jgi:hypothetical protein